MSFKHGATYETYKGFFVQDDGDYALSSIPPRFGLKDTSEARWAKLKEALDEMMNSAQPNVSYKLIFAGRHGQGYHNLAMLKYGEKIWNEKWSKLNGDGEITWGPDPLLTDLGKEQARAARATWKKEMEAGILLPDKVYCSPMTRAIDTCSLTFEGVLDYSEHRPLILENCREQYGVHTCDKRRSRTYLRETFPEYMIEDGFSEEDELYDPNVRESEEHIVARGRSVLDYIFEHGTEPVISITAHSGFIRGLEKAANHSIIELPVGGVLPFIVKRTAGS